MDKFEDIRSYALQEIPSAVVEMCNDEYFRKAMMHVQPFLPNFFDKFAKIATEHDFQETVLFPILSNILSQRATGLDIYGVENIEKDGAYTYISNHRDILLDASLLCLLLSGKGYKAPYAALGNNLLVYPWMTKLVKLNKSVIVYRNLPLKRTLEEACRLSECINLMVSDEQKSVWIAQREGRAKNSDDRTQESVLKMLSMRGEGDCMLSKVQALNIVPVSICYEYDPCDYLKAKEYQQKRDNPEFKKSKSDDLVNMATGMLGRKGDVSFIVSKPISSRVAEIPSTCNKSEFYTCVAKIVDQSIHAGYKIHPINYIAYTRYEGDTQFADKFTPQQEVEFDNYINGQIAKITDLENPDYDYLRDRIYEMYSNPLKNKLAAQAAM